MSGFDSNTMGARAIEDIIVFVHGTTPPTDAEWDRAMALFGSVGSERVRSLVWTEGAAPNAAQRAKLAKAAGTAKPPIAVLTSSALARAAGTAISWFNPAIRIFAPADTNAALDHLDLPAARRPAVLAALEEMKAVVIPRDRARTTK